MSKNQKQTLLPWGEIIDRLYHRQDPGDILNDLVKRNKIDVDDLSRVLSLISGMKEKIESFRLGK
jgi:hypothetical protein